MDFGFSEAIENDKSFPRIFGVVTVWYRSPELLIEYKFYTTKIDIWSSGYIFRRIVHGTSFIQNPNKRQEYDPTIFSIQIRFRIEHIFWG
jgi:serine/threonine protein kinase